MRAAIFHERRRIEVGERPDPSQPQRFELVSSTVYTDGSTVQVLRPAGHDR